MAGKNSFSKDNKFALYVDKKFKDKDTDYIHYRVKSDKYPMVDFEVENAQYIDKTLKTMDDTDERNLSGIKKITFDESGDLATDAFIDEKNENITISIFDTSDVNWADDDYEEDIKIVGDNDVLEMIKHELAHAVDDELTPEKYKKDMDYFELYAFNAQNIYDRDGKYVVEMPMGHLDPTNDEHFKHDYDRYVYANTLKKQATPTINELVEYARFKRVDIPIDEAYKMREKWSGPDGMVQKRSDTTMKKIEDEIRSNKFYPIETNKGMFEDGILTDGKHRILVAKKLGLKTVPVDVEEYV